MSKHFAWTYKTEEEALQEREKYKDHPYYSLSLPSKSEYGFWIINVTYYECD